MTCVGLHQACTCDDCRWRRAERQRRYRAAQHPPAPRDLAWMDQAACRGMDQNIFYPPHSSMYWRARTVCKGCNVRFACLDDAIASEPGDMKNRHGMRGGLDPMERHRFARLFDRRSTVERLDSFIDDVRELNR